MRTNEALIINKAIESMDRVLVELRKLTKVKWEDSNEASQSEMYQALLPHRESFSKWEKDFFISVEQWVQSERTLTDNMLERLTSLYKAHVLSETN